MIESAPIDQTIRPGEAAYNNRRRAKADKLSGPVMDKNSIPAHYAWLMLAIVLGLVLYYDLADPNHKTPTTLVYSSLTFMASCLPMFIFLKRGKVYQVPAFEAHCMFYAIAFGLAGYMPIPPITATIVSSEADMDAALGVTLLGMAGLLAGYYLVGTKLLKKVKPIHPGQGIPGQKIEILGWLFCCVGGAVRILSHEIASVGQIGGYVYALGFFLLIILTLEKRASLFTSVLTLAVIVPVEVLINSGLNNGQLAGVVTLACWVSLVILRIWRRISLLLLAGAFVFFIILQPVKFYVRDLSWNQGVAMGPVDTMEAYATGFQQVYGTSKAMINDSKDNFENSFARINHLATTASIIRDTPNPQPYQMGATYMPLFTKWIPRMFWPDKPVEGTGHEWAMRYGYLGEEDSGTSFNLPWLPEMYMNFGWPGVFGLMFLLGIIFRLLWSWLMGSAGRPLEYAVAIVFAQSLVFAESNFSLMFGGIIVFAIILVLLLLMARLLGFYETPAVSARRAGTQPSREQGGA